MVTSPFRLPVPDENGRFKDKHLPERLSEAGLNATYVRPDDLSELGIEEGDTGEAITHRDENGRLSWWGVNADGTPPQRTLDALKLGSDTTTFSAKNEIHEWWIRDPFTWLGDRLIATLYGSIDGTIRAVEWRPGMGVTVDVEVGRTANIDDHNAPGHWAVAGKRAVMVWQRHNADNLIRVAVSAPGPDVSSWENSVITEVPITENVSYGSAIHIDHLSDDTQDTFWCPVRSPGNNWKLQQFSVNQRTGAVTVGPLKFLVQSTGGQFYCSFADAYSDGEQVLRIAAYHNPAQPDNHIWYLELNCVTGALTSPLHPNISHNVNTATADLQLNGNAGNPAITPMLSQDSNVDRRMFYVSDGPYKPRVAYAEWPAGQPDSAEYRVYDIQAKTFTAIGPAGPRFGYTPEANYLLGMAFDAPAYDDTVYAAINTTSSGSRIERHWTGRSGRRSKVLVESDNPLIRPIAARNGGPLLYFFDLESYDYFLAHGHLKSVLCR